MNSKDKILVTIS